MYKQYSLEKIFEIESQPILKIVKNFNSTLILSAFPNLRTKYQNFFSKVSNENKKTLFHKMTDIYQDENNYFPNDLHPTKVGHSIMSKDLFNFLMKNKLIPCDQ